MGAISATFEIANLSTGERFVEITAQEEQRESIWSVSYPGLNVAVFSYPVRHLVCFRDAAALIWSIMKSGATAHRQQATMLRRPSSSLSELRGYWLSRGQFFLLTELTGPDLWFVSVLFETFGSLVDEPRRARERELAELAEALLTRMPG